MRFIRTKHIKFSSKIVLGLIFLLAIVLRVFSLGDYPALNADEAALGYNAYSLIKTGLDEHGNFWPIHFESFGDYKPGLTVYLIMPFVWAFGLNVWSVRIFPALLGAINVVAIYFLAKRLRKDYLKSDNSNFELVSALFLAISPWHIHFSRGAWEVNIATLFITLGVYFAVIRPSNIKHVTYSIIFFVLSMYTYHSARVIAPLLFVLTNLFYVKEYLRNWKKYVPAVIIGIILVIPLVISMLSSSGLARAGGVSIFSDPGIVNRINERRNNYPDPNALHVKLQHNRVVYYSIEFFNNWLSHFSPGFLFLSGDEITRNKVPNMGELYLFELVTLLSGIYFALRKWWKWRIIIIWLLIAPIPAALTFQSPHALRAQNMVIPLVLISSYGAIKILERFNNKNIASMVFVGIMIASVANYLNMYYSHMSKEYPFSSQYGVEQLVEYVSNNEDRYEQIVVTDRYDQPYILFLFYKNYPPDRFQSGHLLTQRDEFGFSTVPYFDKYRFETIKFDDLMNNCSNCLVAGTDEQIPNEASIIKEIYFPNGEIAFQVAEIK